MGAHREDLRQYVDLAKARRMVRAQLLRVNQVLADHEGSASAHLKRPLGDAPPSSVRRLREIQRRLIDTLGALGALGSQAPSKRRN